MTLYLPIAEMSISVLTFLALGASIGFISGLFGVGGGFLLTPLLTFLGIPPAVAVATSNAHVVASSVSGAITQYRRRNVDVKMAAVMLCGGLAGTFLGVEVVRLLRKSGYFELSVTLTYVVFLGVVGTFMLVESIAAWRQSQTSDLSGGTRRRGSEHSWIERLPLKMRFHRSKLYVSCLPPIVIGMFIGFLSAIMGIGGGFVLIPAMIYLLRMPTTVVVGTSLFQIVFVAAFATILHAVQNKTVDVVLAAILILGGVVGAQFGSAASERLRSEHLRILLASLVLIVALRMAFELVATPSDLFSIGTISGGV